MSRVATLFAFALVVIGTRTAEAQLPTEGAPCSYELCAVRYTSGFSGEHLLRGASSERALKVSFTGSNAVNFLSRVDAAAAPARSFKTRRTRSLIFGLIGAAAAGYVYASAASKADGDWWSQDPSATDITVLIVGFGFGIAGGIEGTRSRNDLSRAIWEFNRAPVR